MWGEITYPSSTRLGMEKKVDYDRCNYLSMLVLKLNHVNKSGPRKMFWANRTILAKHRACIKAPLWRHHMEAFPALLAMCVDNSLATAEFHSQRARLCFYQTGLAWSVDQGSNKNHSPAYNFAPTVTKFCVMWEGLSLPHDTKFGNCRCKIVDSRVFPSWSLIHGLRWSGLIKAEPVMPTMMFLWCWSA